MRALTIFKQKDLPAETKLKEIPPDEQAILDCIARTKKFVTQRALVTAGASAIPIPGINVTVDVTMLMSILNFINQEFGLTPQQIQHLSTDKQVQLFQMITVTGSAWAGKLITKSLVLAVLKKAEYPNDGRTSGQVGADRRPGCGSRSLLCSLEVDRKSAHSRLRQNCQAI